MRSIGLTFPRTLGVGLLAATMIAAPSSVSANTSASNETPATVSVLHAIPDLFDNDAADVYADSTLIARGLSLGEFSTTRLRPGTYTLTVVPTGESVSGSFDVVTIKRARFEANGNHTVALHLSPTMATTLTVFTNKTRTVGRDMGRLTVRNIAQGPAVDIRSRGSVLMGDIRPGSQQEIGLRSGDYRVHVVKSDTRSPVVPPSRHRIFNAPGRQDMGDNRIVYLLGSQADGSLDLAIQEIPLGLR